ncbi:Mechanosensitive ion channel family protein [Rubrivivax sp. A210]|uniref:mechanosensitive ion channel family protein n=1 Tax=Rubrivivax sp. A210 TaxID=2772301 RepID=UPI001917CD06|nr:mechanosensitive ion channel family protein [Rubrivivax sp. A210]CAD5372927.1 Mechanosensitive ion channel family protein [Rubrivivax sp. A210]
MTAFRSDELAGTATERAALAQQAMAEALAAGGPGVVTRVDAGNAVRFDIDGRPVFFITTSDVAAARGTGALSAVAHQVQQRLQLAVAEHHEMRDPRKFGIGLAYALAATAVAWALLWLLLRGQRWVRAKLLGAVQGMWAPYLQHARSGLRWATAALAWALGLLLAELWLTFVLRQFAYTRPWGERSTTWLLEVADSFFAAIAGAIPGLTVAVLIFVLARLATRATAAFLERVAKGEAHLGWLDADTAMPTRRLVNVVIWLFALAMAYPYLPGSGSDAFKGVSVLAGLMLSLGASGVVGQAMSGLSLMYSRSLRVGEYVKIGETEGTVVELGLFATRIHTGMGEEVSLPNTVIFSQPVRNFSRLVQGGRFVLHTAVTIGYSTPWRQVHAMLLEAARRTPGVALEPPPSVVQTALSDFYVEYRLCAQSTQAAAQRRAAAMSALHGNVLDVFNENGVQIMSPHYRSDPAEAQVVRPGDAWAARAPQPPLKPDT